MERVKDLPISELNDKIAWLDRMIKYGDKRRHPRKKVKLPASFAVLKGGEVTKDHYHGKEKAGVVDMSVSGAGVVTSRPMSLGEKFLLLCGMEKGRLKMSLQVVRQIKQDRFFHYGCAMDECEKIA